MTVYELISKKRDGLELTDEEIAFIIDGFTKGNLPDYQMASFLMATYFQSMNDRETMSLTRSMLESKWINTAQVVLAIKCRLF